VWSQVKRYSSATPLGRQGVLGLKIPCIGLECGGTSAAQLREAGAVETWRDPAHLLQEFDHSILCSPT